MTCPAKSGLSRSDLPGREKGQTRARMADRAATAIIWLLAALAPLVLLLLGGYILEQGWKAVNLEFLISPSSNMEAGRLRGCHPP